MGIQVDNRKIRRLERLQCTDFFFELSALIHPLTYCNSF